MPTTDTTIDNLMKVSLIIRRRASRPSEDPGQPFEFIYGLGAGGITPFEKALFGKQVGDRITVDVPQADACRLMGHLEQPFREQTGLTAPGSVEMVVSGVARAHDRDVVKAMAAGGSCSDCGCGCGGH